MVAVLTYDILLRVFEFAHESIELPLDTDSNEVKPWGSSHTSEVLEFSLVSRDWRIAAQQTLFRSVVGFNFFPSLGTRRITFFKADDLLFLDISRIYECCFIFTNDSNSKRLRSTN